MKYILKKVITLIVALLLISIIVFLAFSVLPADAAVAKLGQNATPERLAALREQMGLNQPVYVRYIRWFGSAVQGNFGESLQYTEVSVNHLISSRLMNSALLSLLSFLMVIVFSIPIGIFSAKRKTAAGKVSMATITQITMGIPSFFLALLLTYAFSIGLRWFLIGQYPSLKTDFGELSDI